MAGTGGGKRAGSRRGQRPPRRFQPALLLLALGITACIVAWGYLVYAAIDFGTTARDGDPDAWWFLGLASLGAVACLFVGLMLVARVLRRLGITSGGTDRQDRPRAVGEESSSPSGGTQRSVGGRRAAR